jgi:restriction system protein
MAKRKGGKFSRFMIPILDILKNQGGSGTASEVTDAVIEMLDISEEELSENLKNGSSKIRNQIAWARMYLVSADYIDSSTRGIWALTDQGLQSDLSEDDLFELIKTIRKSGLSTNKTAKQENEKNEELPDIEPQSTALLDVLKQLSPAGFERLCQRLLRESGFEKVTVTGKSSDGGIDGNGILKINPFVSFKVIFQCKRYKETVGAPQIRDFRGAMMGRADKGIFITTGRFTMEAKKEARRDGVPPIEIVDGEKLVDMFEQLELGVTPVTTYEVDMNFFNEFKR